MGFLDFKIGQTRSRYPKRAVRVITIIARAWVLVRCKVHASCHGPSYMAVVRSALPIKNFLATLCSLLTILQLIGIWLMYIASTTAWKA